MRKHVHKILCAQRDLLSAQAIGAVEAALTSLQEAAAGAEDEALTKQMANLEEVANKWLKPYPNAAIRENVEVLLVALAVALGIRTFFVQPFKIPTGSMQPTLFGVTPSPPNGRPHLPGSENQLDLKIPGPVGRFFDYWINGNSYFNVVAPKDGELQALKAPVPFLLFNFKQEYEFNNRWYTVWFPPDELFQRAGYVLAPDGRFDRSPQFKAGDPVVRLKVVAGDHLFVDRLTYNFRHPKRGEIVVFETAGIPAEMRNSVYPPIPPDEFYIKRLVVLGGERVQMGNDQHLIINGHRLDTNTPHFQNVYGFQPGTPATESHYSGHVYGEGLAPLFYRARQDSPDGGVTVDPGHYMVMGDNTLNSLDSRYWGEFPEQYVIGKYFFVYWPFSTRFGWNVE
jgi:signal peptidase I